MKRRTMIEYPEASQAAKVVYDDALAVLGMNELPNWLKALGGNAHVLQGAWENYKNTVLTGDVPPLLKQLILFVISIQRGNAYCSASHGYTAMHLDKTLSCDDLYSLARGQALQSLPRAFQSAIDVVTSAALHPDKVLSGQLDFQNQLRDAGYSEHEIDELMGLAELGLMMNAIMSLWDIPAEKELPPPSPHLAAAPA